MGIESVTLRRDPGDLAEHITVEWLGFDAPYVLGEQAAIAVSGRTRTFRVETLERHLTSNGWQMTIDGLTLEADLSTRAPKKTWTYISMTEEDYAEFLNQLDRQGATIPDLDFVPKIRQTADEFGVGGWRVHEILRDMVVRGLGLTALVVNLPDFSVKQFSIDPGRTFYTAIGELTQIFNPLIYVFGSTFYILDSSSMADVPLGEMDITEVLAFDEEVVRKDGAEQLTVQGDLGEFRPGKYRGYAGNTSTEVWYVTTGEQINAITVFGTPRLEEITYRVGNDITRVKKLVARDVFGNDSYVLWEEHQRSPSLFGLPPQTITQELTIMGATHWRYARPREFRTRRVSGALLWAPSGNESSGVIQRFYPEVEVRVLRYFYDTDGTLISQEETLDALAYTEDNETYTRLDQTEAQEMSWVGRVSMRRWEIMTQQHTPLSENTYAVRRTVLTADESLKYTEDTQVQIVQAGSMQGSVLERRKMRVYAAKGLSTLGQVSDNVAVLDNEAVVVMAHTASWDDVAHVFDFVERHHGRDEVHRRIDVPTADDVLIGMTVDFSGMQVFTDVQLPTYTLDGDYIVEGYEITESNAGDHTRILCKGFLQ